MKGSSELDNGRFLGTSDSNTGSLTSSYATYDMGDMGKLTYQEDSGDVGINLKSMT